MTGISLDGKVLVAAALSRELRPLVARLDGRREGSLPHGALHVGRCDGTEIVTAVLGDGAERCSEGLAALSAFGAAPRRALLIGVAGGLDPKLGVGDVVRVARVLEAEGSRCWDVEGAGGVSGEGVAVTASRIVGTRREKEALWGRLGRPRRAVVDLESALFAMWASAIGAGSGSSSAEQSIDWAVLRAVSDPQGEDLPLDFAAASDAGGHVVGARIASQLARRPSAVGALAELRRRVSLCADHLAGAALGWLREGRR